MDKNPSESRDWFRHLAHQAAAAVGSSWAFVVAVLIVLIWGLTGPVFHYSDTWQLVINTGTTIVTFLMVFVIQNTQNRDARAMHLKLDELLRGVSGARTNLVDLEDLNDQELDRLQREFERLGRRTRHNSPGIQERIGQAQDDVEEERLERRDRGHRATT